MDNERQPNNVAEPQLNPGMVCTDADWEVRFAAAEAGYSRRVAEPAAACDLSKYIDHTLLKPGTTKEDIERLCSEARRYNFAVYTTTKSFDITK
jgi:hypothetical protein